MSRKRLVFVFGTTAEWIKIRFVLKSVSENNISFSLLNTNQHGKVLMDLVTEDCVRLNIKYVTLDVNPIDLTHSRFLRWLVSSIKFLNHSLRPLSLENRLDKLIVVHGDTITALLGALTSKFRRLRLAHIEAGLRSRSFFHPFPEEMIRVFVDSASDYNFAPNANCAKHILFKRGELILTSGNTSLDSIIDSFSPLSSSPNSDQYEYIVVSLHRQEFLKNRRLLHRTYEKIIQLSEFHKFEIVLDSQTMKHLRFKVIVKLLASPNIRLFSHVNHQEFLHKLFWSEFVFADSGGIQEESQVLGFPLLIHRKWTEREDGLNSTVKMSSHDLKEFESFLQCYKNYRYPFNYPKSSPSAEVANFLLKKSVLR